MRNPIDVLVGFVSPMKGLARAAARQQLSRFYEASRPSTTRVPIRDGGSGDTAVAAGAVSLRTQARYFDENHDLARGVINDLVRGVVGRGISSAPSIRDKDGNIAKDVNNKVRALWKEWQRNADTTQERSWAETQRLACRSWIRDGEVFAQKVIGKRADISYPSKVPFLIELLESDMVPFDLSSPTDKEVMGITRDAWGRPKFYKVLKEHPGNMINFSAAATKNVAASRMMHVRLVDRISQTRGVSVLASVLVRMDDLKDYEESERVAARVAAAMTGFIKRSESAASNNNSVTGERMFEMAPGLVYDNLQPGEDVGMIKSDRPNVNLETFRNGQIRTLSTGTGASYSNVSRDYSGSYSSQRQEMVMQTDVYGALRGYFISAFVDPSYRTFIDVLRLARLVDFKNVDIDTIYSVEHRGAPTPWIDPLKEAKADTEAMANGVKSQEQVIRDRSGNPEDVLAQIERERGYHAEKDLTFEYYTSQSAQTGAKP